MIPFIAGHLLYAVANIRLFLRNHYIWLLILVPFASCMPTKVVNKPGTYKVTGLTKQSAGNYIVKFNNRPAKYRIFSTLESDTLKLGDSIRMNIIKVVKR